MSILIAIGGVSRSGKSSLALSLHKQLPDSIILCQDDFVQPEAQIPRIKDRTDWEHPDSINWPAWQRAVHAGIEDNQYLILEGLFMFHPLSLPVNPDFNYYLSIDKDKFLEARRQETRWGNEPPWFIEHVWQSHFKYGLPSPEINTQQYHHIEIKDYPKVLKQITS